MEEEQKQENDKVLNECNTINILQEDDNDAMNENNKDVRYTEVENDFLSNPIEGLGDPNDPNKPVEESNPQEQNGEINENVNVQSNNNQNPLYNKQIFDLKIIVIGDIAVGKTSVISRYITNTFSEDHKSSIGCEYKKKKIELDAETAVNLQIWDTAGEERFMSVTRQYYNDSHGAMVTYDMTDKESFNRVDKWISELKNHAPKNIVIMVVGNKSDLLNEKVDLGNDLENLKKKYLYCEVSAKKGTNVSLAFENLTIKIVENEKAKKEKGERTTPPRESVALKKSMSLKKKKKCFCNK